MQVLTSQYTNNSFVAPKPKRLTTKIRETTHALNVYQYTQDIQLTLEPISRPQRWISPYSLFQDFLNDDTMEDENKNLPKVPTFKYFNNINEVYYVKDRNVILAYVENDPNSSANLWSEASETLGLQEESKMIECYKLLELFKINMQQYYQLSEQLKLNAMESEFGRNKQEYDKLRKELQRTHASAYTKTTMKRNNPTIIEYNIRLLRLLGYESDEFASRLLGGGIADLYPSAQKKYASSVEALIKLLLEGFYDGRPIEKEEKLLHSKSYIVNVKERIYLMRSINENHELEIEIFLVFEPIRRPTRMEDELEPEFKPREMISRSQEVSWPNENESAEFLQKFYNIKKHDSSDEARTCKIRYL